MINQNQFDAKPLQHDNIIRFVVCIEYDKMVRLNCRVFINRRFRLNYESNITLSY